MTKQQTTGQNTDRSRRLARLVSWIFMLTGTALVALSAFYLGFSSYAQAQLKNVETASAVREIAEPDFIVPAVPQYQNLPPNTAPNTEWIAIPSIGVDSKTVELGTVLENGVLVWETPKHAVGHHKGTANPGEIGNVVMSGHISSPVKGEGNVFSRLPEIAVGDQVVVTTPVGYFHYEVIQKRVVLPEEITVMDPTPEPVLTLITCVPDWVYTHRLIVTAKPVKVEPR